jgi:hypothetical protein
MPKGLITRFIVAMHPHILDQAYVWKSGVILQKDNTRAEVIEVYHRRQLQIRVEGALKRDLLTLLIYTLDELHRPFQGLQYEKLIPCHCPKCLAADVPNFYEYEDLRRRLSKGKSTVECKISYKDVLVQGLLDEVINAMIQAKLGGDTYHVHVGPTAKFDQRGQNIEGDQYNAGRDARRES